MQGVNMLTINHATMIEAVQLWIDAQMKNPPTVVSVVSQGSSNLGTQFTINLEVKETKE